jgi:hypothetical protein
MADTGVRLAALMGIAGRRMFMTEDDFEVELEDLALDEIRELLLQAGAELTLEQAEQLARFVHQAGGLQAALEALQQLLDRREAA